MTDIRVARLQRSLETKPWTRSVGSGFCLNLMDPAPWVTPPRGSGCPSAGSARVAAVLCWLGGSGTDALRPAAAAAPLDPPSSVRRVVPHTGT